METYRNVAKSKKTKEKQEKVGGKLLETIEFFGILATKTQRH
jgi:hypothetical protein